MRERAGGRIPSAHGLSVRDPERILIVRLSHLGDVVHALGVFHALHAAFPRARIAWAVQTEFAELVAGLPGLERTLLFERHGGLSAWARLRRELRDFAPDLAVDAQGNAKSGAVTRLSRARRRVASARADWQEPWAAWTANEHAPARGPDELHALSRMQLLVRQLVPAAELPLRTDPALSPGELAAGEAALRERLPSADESALLLHLSSPGDARSWPGARWRELIETRVARGRGVLVLSGPAEAELGRELERLCPPGPLVAHWIGQRGLRALASVLAAAARRGLALVVCDSGPLHLAVAVGTRVVALEGPQDARRTGPWPSDGRHRVARAVRAPTCAPCLARRCTHPDGPVCMERLTAGEVLARLEHA